LNGKAALCYPFVHFILERDAMTLTPWKRRGLIACVLLAGAAVFLGYRGNELSRRADEAERLPVPAELLKGQPQPVQARIERAFRACLGQAVLDGVAPATAAPACTRSIARTLAVYGP
jgi:hypothetical protein